jgi:anti-anti-sigma regulatory factor
MPDHTNLGSSFEPVSPLTEEEQEFDELVEQAFVDEWFMEAHAVEKGEGRIVLEGEVDMAALGDLESALSELEDLRTPHIRVELSGASFVSTAAMLRIIDAASHADEVTVSGANMTVRRIFSVLDPEGRCELVD